MSTGTLKDAWLRAENAEAELRRLREPVGDIANTRMEIKLNLERDSMLDEPERALLRRVDNQLERLAAQLADKTDYAERMDALAEERLSALEQAQELARQNAQDAERYRWLRDVGDGLWLAFKDRPDYSAKACDANIDAARAALGKEWK